MKKIILLLVLCCSCAGLNQKKEQVIATINNNKVTVDEFKKVYEKNLDAIDNEESKDVTNNLDLYINYLLKVKEAYDIKLDTLTSYKKEIETYKNQLSAPYMQDSAFINKLVKDAYYRTANEIKAKHILVRSQDSDAPKDTLKAFEKIKKIRERIINGEDFEKVAEETSEDDSARDNPNSGRKGNKGNLGFFSAFKMVYSFENAAYNTKVGEVSEPFKSRFGYHILKVDSIRKSKGEVEVAHILLRDKGPKGEKLINDIYARLLNKEQFKPLAREFSDDVRTKSNGGKMKKFGSGFNVKQFEKEAFKLKNELDFSKPFKTRFGWHLVQLLKKHPVKSFKELEPELRNKVRSGSIAQLSEKAVIKKLKSRYVIVENEEAKKIFKNKELRKISKDSLQSVLFSIDGFNISQEKFINYITNRKSLPIYKLFENFKDKEILKYYKENLEKTEPEFASVLKEYKDGLLLFELMQQKIWEKSSKDSIGLKNYFDTNIASYKTKELKKIKGEVMNDYQTYLEKNWIADLRRKNTIEINNKELQKLIKHYQKK